MLWCVHECARNVPGWEWIRVVHLMSFLTPSHPCMRGDLARSTKIIITQALGCTLHSHQALQLSITDVTEKIWTCILSYSGLLLCYVLRPLCIICVYHVILYMCHSEFTMCSRLHNYSTELKHWKPILNLMKILRTGLVPWIVDSLGLRLLSTASAEKNSFSTTGSVKYTAL